MPHVTVEYAQAGVELASLPLVGLGSVCRRQATSEIGNIASTLAAAGIARQVHRPDLQPEDRVVLAALSRLLP